MTDRGGSMWAKAFAVVGVAGFAGVCVGAPFVVGVLGVGVLAAFLANCSVLVPLGIGAVGLSAWLLLRPSRAEDKGLSLTTASQSDSGGEDHP